MEKKKQEMSQIYNPKNEFIFGENGGKGKHLSSFLKNLSLTGSTSTSSKKPSSYKDANSNIYGDMSYGSSKNTSAIEGYKGGSPIQRSTSVGASYTHFNPTDHQKADNNPLLSYALNPNHSKSSPAIKRPHAKTRYADLDDDWDAGLDEVNASDIRKSSHEKGHISRITNEDNKSSRSSLNLPTNTVLDSLYPDLTISAAGTKIDPPNTNKDKISLDNEDLRARAEVIKLNQLNSKYSKFRKLLTEDGNIQIQELRRLSWNGIPPELRAITWQILLGYLPTNKSRQFSTLKRKREEYLEGLRVISVDLDDDAPSNTSVSSLASNSTANREKQLSHQIKIDVKRTNPTVKLYGYPEVQQSLRKILFLWAMRHPASGYVQGINDLSTPFYQIFLLNYIWQLQKKKDENDLFIPGLLDESDTKEQDLLNDPMLMHYNLENFNPNKLSSRVLSIIEADTYWCLSRLLENITDNYIHEQPGIIRQVGELKNLIAKIDMELLKHFDDEGVEFIQFSFRWMNCLLMRELSINLIIRMWDTYLSETPLGFNNFHVYVCAAFLIKFSSELKQKDFQEILLFLQNPPTSKWKEKDIELVLSEAFIWQSLYRNASAHLR
ncbi:uncharacterized protein PRCAT00002036001 [Priceomyces carsonii]|uniref:uncharacterized protein n=1 Tax=Priceomyces carsonii TaxID=28549 RepID=UPI002EDAA992|nr:unnamed protein product [Priceomyces carsonii]